MNWSNDVVNGTYGAGTNKCNKFVYDVLTAAGASPGEVRHTWYSLHSYPPDAGEWADQSFTIPGWRVLGPNEAPMPGDVVSQRIDYSDATGHVMIVGPNGTVIGTSDTDPKAAGIIRQEPEPSFLGDPDREDKIEHGQKVYRRWGK